jgi:hypothetical protein
MIAAKWNDWVLETAAARHRGLDGIVIGTEFRAWVSDPARFVVGFATSPYSMGDAVRLALVDASAHYRKDCDALAGLEGEFFGPTGMLATMACANGGA